MARTNVQEKAAGELGVRVFLRLKKTTNLRGHPIENLLGKELFGPTGLFGQALLAGEKREDWRARLKFGDTAPRLVSMTAAPLVPEPSGVCDSKTAHMTILRPPDEEATHECAPTFFSGAVASSASMQRVFRSVETLQHIEATVLICSLSHFNWYKKARSRQFDSYNRR